MNVIVFCIWQLLKRKYTLNERNIYNQTNPSFGILMQIIELLITGFQEFEFPSLLKNMAINTNFVTFQFFLFLPKKTVTSKSFDTAFTVFGYALNCTSAYLSCSQNMLHFILRAMHGSQLSNIWEVSLGIKVCSYDGSCSPLSPPFSFHDHVKQDLFLQKLVYSLKKEMYLVSCFRV